MCETLLLINAFGCVISIIGVSSAGKIESQKFLAGF